MGACGGVWVWVGENESQAAARTVVRAAAAQVPRLELMLRCRVSCSQRALADTSCCRFSWICCSAWAQRSCRWLWCEVGFALWNGCYPQAWNCAASAREAT